jgi:NAD(P)-dependent dehydrogenase (short-subunit alcohol dehydrogenase family)
VWRRPIVQRACLLTQPHPKPTQQNSGIGRGLVEQLLSRGATVVATARSAAAARERLQPLLEQKGGGARLHVDELDVTDESSVRAWAAGLRGRFERVDVRAGSGGRFALFSETDAEGGNHCRRFCTNQQTHHRPHIPKKQLLVNNSGIYSPDGRRPKLGEFTQGDFTPVFLTNAVGPFLVTQALLSAGVLGGAAAAGAGAGTPPARSVVANVSSVMASHGDTVVSAATPGGYSYRASKAALNIISTTMANDFARDGLAVDVVWCVVQVV